MTPELTESEIARIVGSQFGESKTPAPGSSAAKDETTEETTEDSAQGQADEAPEAPEADTEETQEEVESGLRMADYTRKTQALAAEKRAIEAERVALAQERSDTAALRAEQDQLRAILSARPDLREQIAAAWQETNPRAAAAQLPPEVAAEMKSIKAELSAQRDERFLATVEAEVRAAARQYGVTVAEALKHAGALVESGRLTAQSPVEDVAELIQGRVAREQFKAAQATGERNVVNQIKQKVRAPSVRAEERERRVADPDVRKMKDNEFSAFLREQFKKDGP